MNKNQINDLIMHDKYHVLRVKDKKSKYYQSYFNYQLERLQLYIKGLLCTMK